MDEQRSYPEVPEKEIKTKQGIGLSVKIALSVAVMGAVAAGIFIAVILAK